jgi:hypothetical protein
MAKRMHQIFALCGLVVLFANAFGRGHKLATFLRFLQRRTAAKPIGRRTNGVIHCLFSSSPGFGRA